MTPETHSLRMVYDVRAGESYISITTVIKLHTQRFKMGFAPPGVFSYLSQPRKTTLNSCGVSASGKAAFCFDDDGTPSGTMHVGVCKF